MNQKKKNQKPLVDVVIVKYNVPERERDCIAEVLYHTDDRQTPYNLIVHDNYERDENLSTVWNKLITRSESEFICLLNNDTLVEKKWLEKMLEVFETHEYVGAVGPVSNHAGAHQGGWTKAVQERTIDTCTTLSGFCLLFPRYIFKEVGGFDEKFKLYGEDSDFCNRIMKAGYKLYTRYDVFIYHYKAQSVKEAEKRGKDVEAIKKESAARYRSKHT